MSWWIDAGNALGPFQALMILVIFLWVVGHMLYNAFNWAASPPFANSERGWLKNLGSKSKVFAGAGW